MPRPAALDHTDERKGEYIPCTSRSDINAALKEHFKRFLTEGLSINDPLQFNLSHSLIKSLDFSALHKQAREQLLQEFTNTPDTENELSLLEQMPDTLPHVLARSAHLEHCSFYGLELFRWNAQDIVFDHCDFRHTSQHHLSNYQDATLIEPKFTLDFQLKGFPFSAFKHIEKPKFYDSDDKPLTGFSLSPEGNVIFNGSIKSIFKNIKNNAQAQNAYNNYTCLDQISTQSLLQQAIKRTKMHITEQLRLEH